MANDIVDSPGSENLTCRVFLAVEASDEKAAHFVAEGFLSSQGHVVGDYVVGEIVQVANANGRLKPSVLTFLAGLFCADGVLDVELPKGPGSYADEVVGVLTPDDAYRARVVEIFGLSMGYMLDYMSELGDAFHANVRFYDLVMMTPSVSEMHRRARTRPDLQWMVAADLYA